MKTYVVNSAEELEAVLSELTAPAQKPKEQEVFFAGQDEKDLYAQALDAYAEKFALVNRRYAEIFADLAEKERTGH